MANLDVQYGSVVIPDGDVTPSVDEGTDFGAVELGGTPVERTFTLVDNNQTTMVFNNWSLPAGFSFVGQTPSTISGPPWTATVTVRLDTVVVGVKSGDLSFEWIDEGDPGVGTPYTFAVAGTVTAAAYQPRRVTGGNGETWRGRRLA